MIIELAAIKPTPKQVEWSFSAGDIELEGEDVQLDGTGHFSGEAFRQAQQAHIGGKINAPVLFNCTRCLEPIRKELELEFDSVFVEPGNELTATEVEVSNESLDESVIDAGEIKVSDVVREQILLAVPEQILCKEDCKGLCAKCGSNLNLIDCNCADDDIDPRWAALKNLK
jgi:uncharacterized metal-binding protein YceD (DUF177 family)